MKNDSLPDVGLSQKITVYRKGNTFRVRSAWSETEDLVLVISLGNESAWIVPKGTDIRHCTQYTMLHCSTDDFPATFFGTYGFLSGNHGSMYARTVITGRGNEFTPADLGKLLLDAEGNRFRIMQTCDMVKILIHPENTGTVSAPVFATYKGQELYYEDGTPLYVSEYSSLQMHPMNRIELQEFLLDGTDPLPENTVMECSFLVHRIVHEVLSPGAVVEWVASHSGKKTFPSFSCNWEMCFDDGSDLYREYRSLPSLIRCDAAFVYQANAAQVLDRTVTCCTDLEMVRNLEQMLGWAGAIKPSDEKGQYAPDAVEEMYIPKLKQVTFPGKNGKELTFDFSNVASILEPVAGVHFISAGDAVDQDDLPDRFIRLTGHGKRQYGVALGYSLLEGCTAKGEKSVTRPEVYALAGTKKMYPQAYAVTDAKKGQSVRCVSYKQYFNPEAEKDATAFYMHWQGKDLVVYMDFHKQLKDKEIRLPEYTCGKELEIVEKTPSVDFVSPGKVPSDGVLHLDVNGASGYLVLKIDF